jgi:hypothetical protein
MNVRSLALLIARCGLAGGFTRGFAGAPPNQEQNQGQQTVELMEKTPVFRVKPRLELTTLIENLTVRGSLSALLRSAGVSHASPEIHGVHST